MKGDFSRISHDRRKQYSRVLKQQGRVDLDADHNEGAEIHHHLDRVTRRDVIGPSGVPRKGGAFKLEPTPDHKDLFISQGRFYLDGLVVEVDATPLPVSAVQGDPSSVRVPVWEVDGQPFATDQWVRLAADAVEPARMRVTAVDAASRKLTLSGDLSPFLAAGVEARLQRLPTLRTQPDAPDAANVALTPGTPLLLYLETFERHVTELEDATLREVALGGPDTTTRVKTVWRLLAHAAGDADDCAAPVPNWPPQPGKGRLTTTATATAKSDDPCVLPPEGGYRGVENRLYRVEIHSGGNIGTATYKWSRDNGAIAYAIEGFLPPEGSAGVTTVKLASLGRDRTLGLREGDWVEVTDDVDELTGSGGKLATVQKVDLAERTVRLDIDVEAYQKRNRLPKLRRWDMKGEAVTSTGIRIDGTTDELEDGVVIDFTGEDLRPGDWWAFAARVATADVERLHARSPFNEPRRHARIALLTWELDPATMKPAPKLQDCRKPFDPLTEPCGCCCDVTVGDGVESFGDFTDLQKAIDSIQHKGRVCILKGTHKLKKTVIAKGGPLHVKACGSDARIVGPDGKPALVVEGAAQVTLENLHVAATSTTPLVLVRKSKDAKLLRCAVLNGKTASDAQGPAVETEDAVGVALEECVLSGAPGLVLDAADALVQRNRISGGVGVAETSGDLRIEENDIKGGEGDGVTLGWAGPKAKPTKARRTMNGVVLARNRVSGAARSGIATREPLADDDQPPALENVFLVENDVRNCLHSPPKPTQEPGQAHGGIVLRNLRRAVLHGNRVARNGYAKARAVGILAQGGALQVTENLVEANGGAGETGVTRAYRARFEEMDPPAEQDGHVREVDGVRFNVYGQNGQPVPKTYLRDERVARGLDCGFRTIIEFPTPASSLRMKFYSPGGSTRITAYSASGDKEEHAYDGPQEWPTELYFSMDEIERVRIDAGKNRMIVCWVESDGYVPPQPFQGGIFVLAEPLPAEAYSDGVSFSRMDAAPAARDEVDSPPPSAPRDDAHVPSLRDRAAAMDDAESPPPWDAGNDVTVHDNVVATPRGPALVVESRAAASVQDNQLRADAIGLHGDLLLDQAACLIVESSDSILYAMLWEKYGRYEAAYTYDSNPEAGYSSDYAEWYVQTIDRRVLVRGNQASLIDPDAEGTAALAALRSTDDLIVESNQFRLDLGKRHVEVSVRATGKTLHVRGNRFYERPLATDLSLHATGMLAGYVLLNVAMHCILAPYPLRAEENIVQMNSNNRCEDVISKYW